MASHPPSDQGRQDARHESLQCGGNPRIDSPTGYPRCTCRRSPNKRPRFATVEREIRAKLAEHRAWTDRLRYSPGVRYYHVAYEQLTGAAAENYLRSVVAFVLDKGVDIDLGSLSMASELNMLHDSMRRHAESASRRGSTRWCAKPLVGPTRRAP